MPRYTIRADIDPPDLEPLVLERASPGDVLSEAVNYLGEVLKDIDGQFWEHGSVVLTVEDEAGRTLVRLDVDGVLSPIVSRNSAPPAP